MRWIVCGMVWLYCNWIPLENEGINPTTFHILSEYSTIPMQSVINRFHLWIETCFLHLTGLQTRPIPAHQHVIITLYSQSLLIYCISH